MKVSKLINDESSILITAELSEEEIDMICGTIVVIGNSTYGIRKGFKGNFAGILEARFCGAPININSIYSRHNYDVTATWSLEYIATILIKNYEAILKVKNDILNTCGSIEVTSPEKCVVLDTIKKFSYKNGELVEIKN